MGPEEDFTASSKERALSGFRKWQNLRKNNGRGLVLVIILIALAAFLLNYFGMI